MRRPSALMVALCTACGALDPPTPLPRALSDGVAPWTIPAPITLCLGGARLVPPSQDPGAAGFCTPPERAPCVSDGRCGARERCVCGRCALALCRSDRDCPNASVCVPDEHRCARHCVASQDCPASGLCRAGACVVGCNARADCARGERCDPLGRCVAQACRTDSECGAEVCDRSLRTAELRHPSVLIDRSEAVLFVEVQGEGILRARSADGLNFRAEPEELLLNQEFRAPSTVKLAGRWVMAVETLEHSLAISTSTDGLHFSAPGVLMRAEQAWESGGLYAPSLCPDGADLWMAYGASGALGMARLSPEAEGGFVARRVLDRASGSSRVLDPARVLDPVFWRAVDALESPYLARESSPRASLRMYFSARGAESSATRARAVLTDPVIHWSVGIAVMTDDGGFQTSGFNPIVSRTNGPASVSDARDPAAFSLQGRWQMMLRGTDLAGTDEGLFVALGR